MADAALPQDWQWGCLNDISEFVTSGSRGWAAYYANQGALFIRIGNLTREHINLRFESVVHVLPPASSEGNRTRLGPGDLLISITADLGIIGVVPFDLGEAYVNQHIALVRIDASRNDPRWIGHYLAGRETQSRVRANDDSGAKAGLNLPTVRRLRVALPPLPEQRQIAEVLDTVDEAIRRTEQIIAKLKQVKQGLLHDLLTRGIDDNGELRDPDRHPEQFKESPLGRIPKKWEVSPLHGVADLQVGYAFKSEWFSDTEGVRLLRGENVGYGTADWSLTKRLPERFLHRFQEYLLCAGDVIIGMDRTFTKSGVKVTVLGDSDAPSLLVQRVGRFVPLAGGGSFVLQLLRWPMFHRELLGQQKGMDIPHLSKTEILSPLVPVPPPEEQTAIAVALSNMDARQKGEHDSLEKLRLVKNGLMEDLLTGRVRVARLLGAAGE